MADNLSIPEEYNDFLRELKERIRSAKVRVALSINRELVLLYWQIGQDILNRQQQQGWGAKVIDLLSADLRKAFPEMKGFSARNLKYMRSFAEAYPDWQLVQEVLALITWYHNIALIEKVKAPEERLIDRMPDNCTWDDLMYQIYVRLTIEAGVADSKSGGITAVKEVRQRFGLPS